MKKRILSILLAIVMVVGLMPITALTAFAADGVTTVADLQTAISAGGTVVLDGDIDLGSTVLTFPDNTPVTIDLNSRTLSKSQSGSVLELGAGDDVTITGNGTVSKAGGWYFFKNDSGYLKIEGGTYSKSGYDLVYMSGTSVTEITGGTFVLDNIFARQSDNSTGTISDGAFTVATVSTGIWDRGITITGGTFSIDPTQYGVDTDNYTVTGNADNSYTVTEATKEIPVITVEFEPNNQITTEDKIIEALLYQVRVSDGSTPSYQWYQCDDAGKTNARAIEGATRMGFDLPKDLTEGKYYYYCVASAEGAESTASRVSTVTVKKSYNFTLIADPAEGGTVTASVGSNNNVTSAIEGTNIRLSATANEGYSFAGWKVDGNIVSTETNYVFTMPAADAAVTATFARPLPGKVVVDGVDLVNGEADHAIECGGGTAVYDPTTQTLTLTNAEITLPSDRSRCAGIYINGFTSPVTVKLVGENSITLTDTACDNNGIWNDAAAKLSITGEGSLDVLTYNDYSPFGIWTRNGELYVEDAALSFELAAGSASNGFLVDTNKDITVSGASITAEGYLQNLFTGSDMNLADAEINIVGGECVLYADGDISIEDSTISATATDTAAICLWGDLTIADSDVTAHSVWDNGIYCYGSVTVSGGTAEITSEENDAFRANGGITITDNAEVEAQGYGAGVYTNEILSVESGSLTAKGENWAILARRISENGEGSKPTDDPAAIVLGQGLVEISGAAIKTDDWVYTEVWDDYDWDYYDKWMSRSYFVDENGDKLAEATILPGYSVEYKAGAYGTGDEDSGIKIPGKPLVLADAMFTRENYTQTGWATTDGGEKAYDLKGSYTADEAVTLYPVWKIDTYMATWTDGDGGSYEKEFAYGAEITIPTSDFFEETFRKAGYTLTGWQGYTAGMTMPVGGVTFTAIYTANTYTVSFDTNGGENVDPITVTYGEKYGNLPSSAITGLSGGDSNWYLVDETGNATDTKITKLTEVATARDHTLFVKRRVLEPTVKVTLEVPGAISNNYQYYVPGNSTRVLTATVGNRNDEVLNYTYQWYKNGEAVDGATKAVLTLAGNVSDSGTYKVVVTATLKAESDIVVTANSASAEKEQIVKILHATNTLSYDANGGENAPGSHYTGGETITVAAEEPSCEHYTFAGWNTKADGTGSSYSVGSTYTFANDNGNGGCEDTLYAKWTANTYAVTLETNRGTIREGNVTEYTYGVGAELPTKVTRPGYRFIGWYDNEDCEGDPVTEITTTDHGDKTFYAKWKKSSSGSSDPTYPPIVDNGDNGDVKVLPRNPEEGDVVVITPDPDPGYEVDEVTVTDKNGRPVKVVDNGDGTYSFRQPDGKVKITVTFREVGTCPRNYTCPMYGYADLDLNAWYHDGIHFCLEEGLMNGVSNDQFAPNGTTTRAMIVTILWRLEGKPVVNYLMQFDDVSADMWYTEAIRWAASEKIVEGYGEDFGPNDSITREQMAAIMWRYAKYKGYDVSVGENTNILSYDDAFDVAEWAIPAMQWACGEGLVKGIADGSKMNLAPQGNATRAQAAAILQRFIENVVNEK